MAKLNISFFAMCLVLLFAAISFIFVAFDFHRFAFVIELLILLVVLSLLALSMFIVYHNRKFGWTILGATLVLLLVDMLFIVILTGRFETVHLTTVLFSAMGLLIALFNLRSKSQEHSETEYVKAENYYPYIDKMEVKEDKESKEGAKVKKTFIPGKYIASKKANKFHSPKCDWASRIGKENQIWFESMGEAQAKGFEADRCVG